MTDSFMTDASMIPPLPIDPAPQVLGDPGPAFNQGAQRPYGGIPRFYIQQKRLTADDGTVTFRSVEMVDIITPGDPKSTPTHKVTERIKQMYPREYDAFRKGIEAVPQGWPIDMWTYLNEQQVNHLKALNILTVEQIAELADSNLHRIPMGRTLKNQAVAALRTKKEHDSVEAMRQKEELNKHAIKSLEDANMELQRKLEALEAKFSKDSDAPDEKKRGPGRPPKAQADE